jgi:hypothetical protein
VGAVRVGVVAVLGAAEGTERQEGSSGERGGREIARLFLCTLDGMAGQRGPVQERLQDHRFDVRLSSFLVLCVVAERDSRIW